MILLILFHSVLAVVDLLLLGVILKRPPTSLLRLLNLMEQEIIVAPVGAAVFSIFRDSSIDLNLAVHALAWHGSFFLIGSALLIFRQTKNGRHRRGFAAGVLIAALLYGSIAVDALIIEPNALTVRHLTLTTSKVKKPVRIVFLADLQPDHAGDYERRTLKLVKEQNADLILFGGDYVQGKDEEDNLRVIAELNTIFREADLQAPLGVFAVQGDNDNSYRWQNIFAGTAVRVIRRTKSQDVGELRLTFLDMTSSFWEHSFNDPYSEGQFRIIVGHSPVYAMAEQNADLLLAGHTHGGQVQIPFYGPLITHAGRLPRNWAHGVTKLSDTTTLLVTNGTGLARDNKPRIRFWCRPEICVIDIVPNTLP